jgi:pyridoxamine 5'-phosphate oxidase
MTTDEIFRSTRKEYTQAALDEAMVPSDPLALFRQWYDEALASEPFEPNACALATVGGDLQPACRMVLLKGLDERGFAFYTNYLSQKAQHLAHNPSAALLFFWASRERSVRIEGLVEKVSSDESARYFASRPRASQLGAHVSTQSAVASSRKALEARLNKLEAQFAGQEIPKPEQWGGYRLKPRQYEFWQGRESRLHDRLRYTSNGQVWSIERLWP